MINYIKGVLSEVGENYVVVECGGVGYEIIATAGCFSVNAAIGKEVKIPVYMCVREDGVTLFGFSSREEKNIFGRLIGVSGIGPKAALNILSGVSASNLASAIARRDTTAISSVKGVGKKTAERIALELGDKITAEFNGFEAKSGTMPDIVPQNNDAVIALMSLGYKRHEAEAAVAKAYKEGQTLEETVFKALKG
ncbi:MAG: Holliday junction branch migration protein RuvA [Clostridiales bacterium]|jgi:Holliday junction DNA helicase RuvA|nr:Holliday junction branch migration protein RuvA [Clostridiales bacterium]